MFPLYTFILTYPLFLWAELWLMQRLFGNRFDKALPLPVRLVVLALLAAIPAFCSSALLIPAPLDPY